MHLWIPNMTGCTAGPKGSLVRRIILQQARATFGEVLCRYPALSPPLQPQTPEVDLVPQATSPSGPVLKEVVKLLC